MQEESKNIKEENFSNDPNEQLRIENEILKLKMQAESGAVFGGDNTYLSPQIESQFLQNVQQFEDAWKNVSYVKVYDLLGRPEYRKTDDLLPSEIAEELKRVMSLMNEKDVYLDMLGEYEPPVIYRFITEELFEHETDDMQLPGWAKNFIYEEFHPNHKMDIGKTAEDFLKHWFEKRFDEYALELNSELVTPEANFFTNQQVKDKLNSCLACYLSFSNIDYKFFEIDFQWNEAEGKGVGHAEGAIRYDAEIENGERIYIEGAFKLYMTNEGGYWNIFYFVFPGFAW